MSSQKMLAVIVGSNRGIGLQVRQSCCSCSKFFQVVVVFAEGYGLILTEARAMLPLR